MSGKISKSSGQAINELVLNTVKSLAAEGPLNILDLGCGSGAMLESIAEYYRDRGWEPADHLLGVDINLDDYKVAVPSQVVDLNHPIDESLGKFDPLPVQYWDYGLRYANFSRIEYLVDRRKKSAIIWTLLFCPILLIGYFLMHRA